MSDTLNYAEVARGFSELWHALDRADASSRKMLLDRVRDALDRGESRLSSQDPAIIANTFTLEAHIHSGATTEVYRARHRDLGTRHAIKMLRADKADDPVARELLLHEASVGMAIRHPNVLATQTLLRLPDGRLALVLEWVEHSLAGFPPDYPVSVQAALDFAKALLSGLAAVHAAGFVHGDIAPDNLLYDGHAFDRVKIADFSVAARLGGQQRERDIDFGGRSKFSPPEQLEGGCLDARSDLYAAGRVLTMFLARCSDPDCSRLQELAVELCRARPEDRPASAGAALAAFSLI